jgi:gamma-glutamyl hydrolase
MLKFFLFVAFFAFTSAKAIVKKTDDLLDAVPINNDPMIGVLSQEISYYLDGKYPGQYNSYIAASYVKFVEGGGARVVPIW